jgi:predicted O-linked N-acetylglucosamine transferase (SPINDLY family)
MNRKLRRQAARVPQELTTAPDPTRQRFGQAVEHLRGGRLLQAEPLYREVLARQPDHVDSLHHLGLLVWKLGKNEEAARLLGRAAALRPADAEIHSNLSVALMKTGRREDAVAACRAAVALRPDYAQAQINLACALRQQLKYDEAIAAFREAARLAPEMGEVLVEICELRQHICDWAGLARESAVAIERSYRRGRRVPPFSLLGLTSSPQELLQAARVWAQSSRIAPLPAPPRRAPSAGRRLRLGYLSADFHKHATVTLIAELFERHDRGRFELFAYSYGPDDGSDMRARVVRAFDHFANIDGLTHGEAAALIRADAIDILVDLKGLTQSARIEILAQRPAPVQVNYLGYPGTMGATFIDYIIGDPFVTPLAAQADFDEKIVQLPHCYQPNDTQRPISEHVPSRSECGLPAEGFVFCCFNNTYKITAEVFDVWMRLIGQVPGAVLWLLEANDLVASNLRREAALRGVAADRLVFAPRVPLPDHLARQRLADLFLDTLPVNAHTTASEALWAGLPVVTCAGTAFVGRVAGSLLHAVGLPELVTHSLADYEALALRLARHPGELARLRQRLLENRLGAPLFDIENYTRALEAAFLEMVRIHDAGETPRSLTIEA